MSKPVITFVFKILRNGLLGANFTHVQTCDNARVQSATQWTAAAHTLHMSKSCDNDRVQSAIRNGLLRYILYTSKPVITFVFKALYAMDCFGTYFTHPNL